MYSVDSFLEILLFGLVNVHELLGIPVDHRKPGALDLHHDFVTLAEAVKFIT